MNTLLFLILFVLFNCVSITAQESLSRSVSITIDDLPGVHSGRDLTSLQAVTRKLLGQLTVNHIPAVGFVNEVKLAVPGEEAARRSLLEAWLTAGIELGNHTYSHTWFYETPLDQFKEDVVKGERITGALLAERGKRLRYFRHPRLNTGPDEKTKEAFELFLAERGYTVAPVTIDNDEFVYALAYDNVTNASDTTIMDRIGKDYIRYMNDVFIFYEGYAREILGREPSQTLLIHANQLNADYLDELMEMMRTRGYRFVSLEEALKDPAYSLPDHYTGRSGISWLQRWAITMGKERKSQPEPPIWVKKFAWPGR